MSDSKPHSDRLDAIRFAWVQTYNEDTDNEPLIRAAREDMQYLIEQLEAAEKRLAFFDRILALPSDLWVAALLAPAGAPIPTTTPDQLAASVERIATGRGLNYDQVSSPASGPKNDGMTLRHLDGTPYMTVGDYFEQRGDPPRLRYGDSNQDSERPSA